jgi:hypothetical protein
MNDERQPDEAQVPSEPPTSGSEPPPSGASVPTPPSDPQPAGEPPPLAPLVGQAGTPTPDPLADTTAQPTAAWAAPASSHTPPPIPPPVAQPAVSWAPAAPPVAVKGQRTALAMGAGVLLVVLGLLGALAGLAIAVVGRAVVQSIRDFGPIPELEGMDTETFLSGFILFFGIIIIVYSFMYLFAGIGVLRSRDWGRVLGIIVAVLSGVIWLSGVSGARRTVGGDIGLAVIALLIHVYIVVALLFFWRTKPSTV